MTTTHLQNKNILGTQKEKTSKFVNQKIKNPPNGGKIIIK